MTNLTTSENINFVPAITMTLAEYWRQENPLKNVTVILFPTDYTEIDIQDNDYILIKINGIADYLYFVDKKSKNVFTQDCQGYVDTQSVTCFKVADENVLSDLNISPKIMDKSELEKQEKLIAWYEKRLEKVIEHWGKNWKGQDYIDFAKSELEKVKYGRSW